MPPVKKASDLYGLALDEFTPERNGLVKRLKADGETDEAARVAKLRKPNTAAWAVNQLVRTQDKRIKALFAAGDAMARSQAKGQADRLREATAEQRAELAGLIDRAAGLLDSEGRPPPASVIERVGETLRAAAIDPDCREQVKDGCLTRELQFTGLAGFGAGAASAPAQRRPPDKQADQQHRQQEIQAAREDEKQAKQERQQAQMELRQAERELKAAERTRDAAAKQVDRADEALAEATRRLNEAQRGGR